MSNSSSISDVCPCLRLFHYYNGDMLKRRIYSFIVIAGFMSWVPGLRAQTVSEDTGAFKPTAEINDLFFAGGSWGYINNQFTQFLFSHYPELYVGEDAFAASGICGDQLPRSRVRLSECRSMPGLRTSIGARASRAYPTNSRQCERCDRLVVRLRVELS